MTHSKYQMTLHEMAKNILKQKERYLKDHIYPAFHGIPESDDWYNFMDFLEGSILAHHETFAKCPIIEHYRRDDVDYLVIERNGDTIHCFLLFSDYIRNLVWYKSYDRNYLNQCKESEFLGKTIHDIVNEYDIPLSSEIPYLV